MVYTGETPIEHNGKKVVAFLESGEWTIPDGVTKVDVLVVAGGGGGGTREGGGGGAGTRRRGVGSDGGSGIVVVRYQTEEQDVDSDELVNFYYQTKSENSSPSAWDDDWKEINLEDTTEIDEDVSEDNYLFTKVEIGEEEGVTPTVDEMFAIFFGQD